MRKYLTPACIILVLTVVSVVLHARWCGTPMQSSEARWQEIVQYHVEFYPFSIRYLTTYPVIWIHQSTGLPLRETFFIFQYLLMATVGLVFYRFLRLLGFTERLRNAGLILFMASFPILFAHSEPVFTWDDPWVYLALVLSFSALMQKYALTASLWFALGLFAREQTLLYYPVFLLGLWLWRARPLKWPAILAAILPAVLFLPFWFSLWQEPDPVRYQLLAYNFSDWSHTINTLFSVFIAFGFLWVAWIAAVGKNEKQAAPGASVDKFLKIGSILMVVPTLIIGIAFAYARETRIFFPPFVLIIPMALVFFGHSMPRLGELRGSRRIVILGAFCIGTAAGAALFRGFDYRNCPDFCKLWGGIHLGLSVALLAIVWMKNRLTGAKPRAGHGSD